MNFMLFVRAMGTQLLNLTGFENLSGFSFGFYLILIPMQYIFYYIWYAFFIYYFVIE